jgi:hypothetical protein
MEGKKNFLGKHGFYKNVHIKGSDVTAMWQILIR